TTAADAYLGPVAGRYLRALAAACTSAGLPEPLVMRSSGGVATPEEAAAHPATILVSGPAAGAVGAARLASLAGFENAIGLDMGGTSTDVCLVTGGRAERTSDRSVGGLPIRLPSVDIHTVGAGGGSLVWRDRGGARAGGRGGPFGARSRRLGRAARQRPLVSRAAARRRGAAARRRGRPPLPRTVVRADPAASGRPGGGVSPRARRVVRLRRSD